MIQTTETNDALLSRARGGDRAAVDALIRQFAGLVYGAALRQTRGDAQQAADVSQAVFMVFVRRVGTIRAARALPGWFLQTTRYAAREAHRAAARRSHHEHRAARAEQQTMDANELPGEADPKLGLLDDAIASLRQADRDVVLMRYLQGRDVRAIAADLGLGEEAARKRISRAINRMREFFEARGVVASADAVTALLATAGTTAMPPAVLEACASAGAGGAAAANAGAIAKGMLYSLGAAKLKAAAAVAGAAAVFVTVGTIAIGSAVSGPRDRRVVVAPVPPGGRAVDPAAVARDRLLTELNRAYGLADGQAMRVIRPPFPPARHAFADAEFPYAKGSQNLPSLGFRAMAGGGVRWQYMSYTPLDLRKLLDDVPWYRVEGSAQIKFPPIPGDLVLRDGAGYQEQLDAALGVVAELTGARFRAVRAQTTRPCVIFTGPTRRPAESRKGFATLVLTQSPLDDSALRRWLGGDHPEGTLRQGQLQPASRLLDTPFFVDGAPASDGAALPNINLYLIAPDAQLDWRDRLHEARLRKIVDNLARQIGGEWRIEQRTLEVFRIEPASGGETPRP